MTLKLITGPTVEPVTLEEAKAQCRVDADITSDDDLIESLIAAARETAEHETGRALIAQTWERVVDAFPSAEIELGMPTVMSVVSINYVDINGDTQTMDAADYSLDADLGFVLPAINTVWPETLDTANAVRVQFIAGYGDEDGEVPASIKAWLLLKISSLYVGGDVWRPEHDRLLDRHRVWGV